MQTDGHVIALEERTFDEDEEPHHVIQDDILGGEHDSHHKEDDGRDDRVQLEDGQGHDHEAAQHTQAEELCQEVFDRPNPFADLVGRARPGRKMRRLRVDDGGHQTVDRGEPDPVDDEQHDGADQQADPSGEDPAKRLVQIHLAPSAAVAPSGAKIMTPPTLMVEGVLEWLVCRQCR